jgi:hypothetical protein
MLLNVLGNACSLVLVMSVQCGIAQQKYQSYDPGHKSFVTLGGVHVSCPNGFSPVATRLRQECIVMRHERFKLALFATTTDRDSARATVDRIAKVVLSDGVFEESDGYRWKDLGDYAKQSVYETGGGRMQGYNGNHRLGLTYRLLSVGDETFIVGYVFDLHGGADASRLFDKNLGGDSVLGAIAETHVICSITGEKYDDLNPNHGGVGQAVGHP